MARVTFKNGQPIQSLSGTIGNLTYRTINGKTFVHARGVMELSPKASKHEKALYRRRMIVDECVRIIQDEMEDFVEAIRLRPTIRAAMLRYYKMYAEECGSRLQLQRKMLGAYRLRLRQKKDKESSKPSYNKDETR